LEHDVPTTARSIIDITTRGVAVDTKVRIVLFRRKTTSKAKIQYNKRTY